MDGLAWAAFGLLATLLFMILSEVSKMLAVVKEIKSELFNRLGPTASIFNRQYEETNIHHMLAEIHRVVTK